MTCHVFYLTSQRISSAHLLAKYYLLVLKVIFWYTFFFVVEESVVGVNTMASSDPQLPPEIRERIEELDQELHEGSVFL